MKIILYIIIGVLLTVASCGEHIILNNTQRVGINNSLLTNNSKNFGYFKDTSNQYIYDFMKIVIADQKIDVSYGLTLEPEPNADLSNDDRTFLNTLLIDNKEQKNKKDTGDWRKGTIYLNLYKKCLTEEDINGMLAQKERLSRFSWNNSRLGFDLSNKKNWYSFSIPIFSKDKTKAVILIRDLCPGLCGTSVTVLFIKENNKWTSQKGFQIYH